MQQTWQAWGGRRACECARVYVECSCTLRLVARITSNPHQAWRAANGFATQTRRPACGRARAAAQWAPRLLRAAASDRRLCCCCLCVRAGGQPQCRSSSDQGQPCLQAPPVRPRLTNHSAAAALQHRTARRSFSRRKEEQCALSADTTGVWLTGCCEMGVPHARSRVTRVQEQPRHASCIARCMAEHTHSPCHMLTNHAADAQVSPLLAGGRAQRLEGALQARVITIELRPAAGPAGATTWLTSAAWRRTSATTSGGIQPAGFIIFPSSRMMNFLVAGSRLFMLAWCTTWKMELRFTPFFAAAFRE